MPVLVAQCGDEFARVQLWRSVGVNPLRREPFQRVRSHRLHGFPDGPQLDHRRPVPGYHDAFALEGAVYQGREVAFGFGDAVRAHEKIIAACWP